MNNFSLLLVVLALALPGITWSESSSARRLSEPVEVTADFETFGARLDAGAEALGLAELLANSEENLGRTVTVDTRIAQVCQKKGCFFIAQDGEAVARVSFKDYGFFVPTDAAGKRVRLQGVLHRQLLSEERAAHLEEDLGEDAMAVPPGPTYEIVATAVRLPRS